MWRLHQLERSSGQAAYAGQVDHRINGTVRVPVQVQLAGARIQSSDEGVSGRSAGVLDEDRSVNSVGVHANSHFRDRGGVYVEAQNVAGPLGGVSVSTGASGAAGTGANADTTKWTGDVLRFDVDTATISKVAVGVYTNAVDASIFIQNTSASTADTFVAALDSSTGKLYLDWNSDGTVDSVINLTGVSSLTAAAFQLV